MNEMLSLLELPEGWTPDSERILELIHDRRRRALRRQRILFVGVGSLLSLFIVAVALPSTRAAAQYLFTRFFAGRLEYLPFSVEELTNRLPESTRGMFLYSVTPKEESVGDLSEAVRRAGFEPRLPSEDLIGGSGPAQFSVIMESTRTVTVRTADLRTALNQAHAQDIAVPEVWNDVVITLHESAGIAANYRTIYLAQRLPLNVDTPAGFPLGDLYEVLFRIIGFNPSQSNQLRNRFVVNPSDFLLLGQRYSSNAREVQLVGTSALLVHDPKGRTAPGLVWTTSDRLYALWGTISEGQMIDIANSIQRGR